MALERGIYRAARTGATGPRPRMLRSAGRARDERASCVERCRTRRGQRAWGGSAAISRTGRLEIRGDEHPWPRRKTAPGTGCLAPFPLFRGWISERLFHSTSSRTLVTDGRAACRPSRRSRPCRRRCRPSDCDRRCRRRSGDRRAAYRAGRSHHRRRRCRRG